jgi:vitamin B12 transporter
MRCLFKAALLAASSLLITPAFADTDEEIVVTATRAPTPVRNLPADVTIIDIEDARSRGEATLAQALSETPGLTVSPSGGIGQQTSLFLGGANSNHTLVLFDGLRVNDPSTPGSSFDAGQDTLAGLARIEIVEGPMSAMFGSDAIGGVVNLIPRHGGEGALNARLDIGGGSFGTLSGAVGVDGTVGALRYAVSAEGYATNGFDLVPERMSTHTGEEDGSEMTTLTGVFDLALSPAFALDLLVRHREAQADFDPFLDFFPLPLQRSEDGNLEISQNDLSLARLGATWTINNATALRATFGAMRQEREQSDDGLVTDTFEGERRFGDLTLSWRPDTRGAFEAVSIVAGVSAEREEIDVGQGFGFPPPFFFTTADQDNRGAFVSAQGSLDRLTLTGAVRADEYEGFGVEPTWRIGASYDVFEALRLYAAYGTSFRAPTLYERFVSFGDPDLDAEEARTWEVGADAGWTAFGRDDGLTLAISYRASKIDNLIDFNGFFTYDNVDHAELKATEVRLNARPFEWLTARLAYVHTQTEDTRTGLALLRRPQHAWSASLRAALGPFSGEASYRSVGERRDELYGDDGFGLGQGDAPSYELIRVSGAYEFRPGIQAYVAVENALDETYEPVNAFAGAPRSVLVGLRLRSDSVDGAE